jgi:hypothetical protein
MITVDSESCVRINTKRERRSGLVDSEGRGSVPTAIIALAALIAAALLSLTDEMPEPAGARAGVMGTGGGCVRVGAGVGDVMRPFARRGVLDTVVVEAVDVCLGPLGGGPPGGGAERPSEGMGLGAN